MQGIRLLSAARAYFLRSSLWNFSWKYAIIYYRRAEKALNFPALGGW
jgi:hypothetical protein